MPSDVNARTLALETLQSLERRRGYSDATLYAVLTRNRDLPESEKGLLLHLVYGVLRWRNRLDAQLARASTRPLARIHPKLLDVLRLGTYQVHYLDRIPHWAAISESVELARRSGLAHAAGFVNAVLRKVAAEGPHLPLPEDPGGRLSLLFGCPLWLVEAWLAEHGPDGAERLARASSAIPTLTLRVDTRRVSRLDAEGELRAAGLEAGPGEWAPEAIWMEGGGDPRALPLIRDGRALVQDQGSQLVAHLLRPEPGWRILDACAAPGLKATHLAQLMDDRGEIVATDVHPHRVRLVRELAERLGLGSIRAEAADARAHDYGRESFDAALVDAPCSGLGVLSRTPEAKWRRSPSEIPELAALQAEILDNVAAAVRPGGLLAYVTCTTLRAENEDVVRGFLARHSEYRLEPFEAPAGGEELSSDGLFKTFPRLVGEPRARAVDGFFGARLRRDGG